MGVKVKTWDRLQRQNRVNKIWLLLLREGEELSMKPRFQVCIMESMIMPFTKASREEDWGELLNLVMDREAWHAVLHGFSKSRTRLSDWTELNCRFCSKSFKLGFSSKWTENFQVYELGLEKADDPEIKLPTLLHHGKAREFKKNYYFWFIDYTSLWLCGSQQTVENS